MNNCANNKQSKVTEDIIFEVVSNLDTVCKEAIAKRVRDYLKKELGDEEYFRLKELFFHVCVDEYEYKLLVTRRAYLLYHIFLEIFMCLPEEWSEFGQKFGLFGEFYNSHSMILLKDIFGQKSNQNKKLLLVDDIIVNGRAITEVFDFLRAMDIGKDCIYIWCDLLNMNANCLSSDAKERLETYREATETGWKAASNIFSQAITIFGRGYTSYIDTYLSYNLDSDVNKAILNFLRGDNERIIKSDALKENDVETYICYMELEKNGIIGEHKDISCLRFYVYKDAILVIPYLFIDSIKKEKAYDYAVSLLKKFEIVKIPEVFGIAIQNKNYDLAILFLQWTVNEIGKKLVSDFFKDVIKKNGIEEAVCLYVTEHSETFKFEKNTVPAPNSDAEYICDSNKYSSADIEYCSNIFKRKLMDQGKIEFSNGNEAEQLEMLKAAFKGYKFTVKEEDQRRANTEIPTVNRLIGIRPADMVEIVYNVFTVPEEQKEKILMMLLSLVITSWDDGSTSYNFAPFPEIGGEKIISGFLRNGEQVYRVIYDLYSKVYQYYYVFTLKTLEFRYSQLLNFGEHLTKAISSKKVLPKDVWRFLEYLKIDTSYFEDVFAVRPKEIPEYVIDDVNLYIEKYYQS